MQYLRGAVILFILPYSPLAEGAGNKGCWCDEDQPIAHAESNLTSNETLKTSTELSGHTTDLPTPTEQKVDRFPSGDALNDPWFKEINFCFLCYDEAKVEGIRNFWPYLYPISSELGGQLSHGTRVLLRSKEIAVDPILRAKLYCAIIGYPQWKEWSVSCFPGNSTYFLKQWSKSPIGMMRDNVPLSVLNAILAFFSLLFGIFGNILIILAILTTHELKSSTNLILLGMAVADCLNSVLIIAHGYLETFLWTITNPVLGPVGCGIVRALQWFSQLVAVNHLITVSFERYFSICWPLKQSLKFTRYKTILIITANWFIAGVQLIPSMILKLPRQINYADYMCHGSTSYPRWIFIVCDLTIYVVLPVPILCFNYIRVVQSLLATIKMSQQMTGDLSGQTKDERARLKLTYMMITLVVIYIITVTPGRIMDALKAYFIIGDTGIFYIKKIKGTVDMVRGINSWTNVIVYTLISRQFRTAFREILCVCWRKRVNSGLENQTTIEETLAGISEDKV